MDFKNKKHLLAQWSHSCRNFSLREKNNIGRERKPFKILD